ncbi:hypothetical protein HK099_006783 [Clydaea vesicula]|uniref:Condensin complex subunit 2 n=1 Tax=Clydaea vesicula TaxID=447962 RepID=A0AAD5TXP4_9FUNG|nr:hypothetical protein HK099_006783 [Clydaea vesicula]KAJ3388548.1 hypothetical protein HDU92_001440 [Lobulomyces angularis]
MQFITPTKSSFQSSTNENTPTINTPSKLYDEDDIKRLFEECIKKSTENKINSANCFDMGLIDYFAGIDVLKDGSSINFQKASCTLDGCIKIYSLRVDSVDSEAKKLLSGLASNYDGEDQENLENDEGKPKKPRKTNTATLEKDPNLLNLKKFDLEFDVDPLFKKTSADFDEGGAKGLLLNNLSIGNKGKIIFDASNIPGNEEKEEAVISSSTAVNVAKLKAKFNDSLQNMFQKDICPSLKNFKFSSDDTPYSMFNPQKYLDSVHEMFSFNPDDDQDSTNDVHNANCDYDSDDNNFTDYNRNPGFGEPVHVNTNESNDIPGIINEIENNERNVDDDAFLEVEEALYSQNDQEMFSYFQKSVNDNWIGPEYWKPKKEIKTKEELLQNTAKPKRKKPEPINIDFDGPPVNLSELFTTSKATINLPKNKERVKSLPSEDFNFNAEKMVSLFIKPDAKILWRTKDNKLKNNRSIEANLADDDNPDVDFWAKHENDEPVFVEPELQEQNQEEIFEDEYSSDDEENIIPLPFASNEGLIKDYNISGAIDYGDQLVDEPRKTKAQYMKYARVSKKVDVKRLKDNIWKSVETAVDLPNESIKSECKFSEVVHGLQNFYSEKKIKDISVAFCFICLLHLANEEGFEIQMDEQGKGAVSNNFDISENNLDNISLFEEKSSFKINESFNKKESFYGMDELTIQFLNNPSF